MNLFIGMDRPTWAYLLFLVLFSAFSLLGVAVVLDKERLFLPPCRVTGRCKHYMISQLETGKFVIVGEPRVHNSLEDMVKFHMKVLTHMKPLTSPSPPSSLISFSFLSPSYLSIYLSSPSLFQHPVNMEGDLLTLPCGQEMGQVDYGDLLDEDDPNFIPVNQPPTIPPRVRAASSFCASLYLRLMGIA